MFTCSLGCYILLIELIYIYTIYMLTEHVYLSLYVVHSSFYLLCGGILREVLGYYTKGFWREYFCPCALSNLPRLALNNW